MPEFIIEGIKYLAKKEFVKQVFVSFVLGHVMQRLQPKPEQQVFKEGLKLNNTSNVAPIPVVYGRARVGGSEFRAVTGSDNKFLLRCMVLSEGEIDSVENIFFNDRLITDISTTPTLQSKVTSEIKLGTQNQTASSMMLSLQNWTGNFKGNGVAYIVTKSEYDRDVFASGLPTVTADVKGKKVYDPRRDDGGSITVANGSIISETAPVQDGATYKNLLTTASGHPSVNSGNLRIWHRDYNNTSGTITSSYSYERDTDTLRITATRNSGSAYWGSYFRIGALKEGVYYRVTGRARVVSNTTGATVQATVDLSDNNDPNEFRETTTSSTFVDFDDSGFFTINSTNNTSAGVHSFIDINLTVGVSSGGTAVVEFQNLQIEELTSGTLNANSNQTVVNATHSKTNPATWQWSENPALCILDFLTNTVYGRGIPYDDIDLQSFISSANYCDDRTLTLLDNSGNNLYGQKRYTCNGVVNPDEESLSTLRKLLISCRGTLVVSDKYKLVLDKPETSVFTFDKSNIIGEWAITGAGVRAYKNRIKGRFFDKNNRYEQGISITTGNTFIADDNNRILEQEVDMPFTNEQQRVDLLSQHLLKQTRLRWTVSFTATLEALALEAMDVVRIKHSTVGWDSGSLTEGKLFRLASVELNANDTVKITATEYDSSVYSFNVNTPPASPSTNLPDPNTATPPSNLALDSTDLLVNKDGTIIERIKATWTPPSFGYVNHYEIAYKSQDDTGFSIISTDDTTFYISPVNSENDVNTGIYFVKVRAVYANDRRSVWYPSDAGESHTVSGKSTNPNRPTGFHYEQLADYTRSLEFVPPSDPDFAGVKIKFSSNLNETYENMTPLHEGIITESPYNFTILSAGTYRFGIKSVDTSGNESTNASFTTGIITDNPNFEILASYYPRLLGWYNVGYSGNNTNSRRSKQLTFVPSGGGSNIVLNFIDLQLEETFVPTTNNPLPTRFTLYGSDKMTVNNVEGNYYLYRTSVDNGATKTWYWGLAFFRTGRPYNGNTTYESILGYRQGGTYTETDGEPITYPYAMTGRYYIDANEINLAGDMIVDTTGHNAFYNLTLSNQGNGIFHLTKTGETYLMENETDVWDLQLSTTLTGNWKVIDGGRGNPSTGHYVFNSSLYGSPSSAFLRVIIYREGNESIEIPITNGAFIDTAGDLTSVSGNNAEWRDLGTTTWDNWNEWGFANETMIYETNGFEFGTTLTFRPVIQSSQVGTVTHQVAIVPSTSSASQPYSASDYGSFFTPSGSVEAKAIKTKTTVTGVNATLLALGILLDGKQTEETLLNIDTSTLDSSYRISAGHIYLPLQKTFNNITTIQVTFINAGGLKSYEIINKTTTVNGKLAPEIKLHHSSATTDATIDVVVKGY